MMARVRDNFESGKTAATAPQKETIMSGAGLSNRSKMTRTATDREGGIILPESMYED